jgi:hypothetical protein
MADKTVRVTLDGTRPVPSQDPIVIKKNSEKIKWCADFDFSITIEGYSNVSKEHGGSDCPFSVKTGTFPAEGELKYSITANGVVNDPVIDIRP